MGSPASPYLSAYALAQTGEGTPAVSQDSGTISNLHCLAAIPNLRKASGVNLENNSGVEPLRRMAGAQHFLPAASAVDVALSCIGSSFPLDPGSYTERGTPSYGQPSVSLSFPLGLTTNWRGHSGSVARPWHNFKPPLPCGYTRSQEGFRSKPREQFRSGASKADGRCSALPSGSFCSGTCPKLYWFFLSLGPSQLHREVDTVIWVAQRLFIFPLRP